MSYNRHTDCIRKGVLKLLEIKDSDIRLLNLSQSGSAIDNGLHAGGASSATIPLVSLYYGGFMDLDIENPCRIGQDMFVLSKGHAVATLASIYADLGYFHESVLEGSRSVDSILNGHPGPILPGIQIATGPMGQGLGVAQGLALAGQSSPKFDVFVMTGDGELQEGPIWEAVMFAGYKRLDNLCVLVDSNGGQLDVVNRLIIPHRSLEKSFESFGWNVMTADSTKYDSVYQCLSEFKTATRGGKPTVIICDSFKGSGSLSSFLNKHKVTVPKDVLETELNLQRSKRDHRVEDFIKYYHGLDQTEKSFIRRLAQEMKLKISTGNNGTHGVVRVKGKVLTKKAPIRSKKIKFTKAALPTLDPDQSYSAHKIIEDAMKAFARDTRVMSVDSDLASTSGLEMGISSVDQNRAINVGVAEANMMLIGEAYAALGYNVWVSTFCPFFDWKVLRRIAVGHQERLEAMETPDGWLSSGYGLDLTFLATAADFETQTNGATHMGNDDALLFDALAQLKIITVSCPQQLLGVMEWIMQGDKGLVYLRILRAPAPVIYNSKFKFKFGKAYELRKSATDDLTIISAGRGVHEALATAELLSSEGISAGVVDMPSVDIDLVEQLLKKDIPLFVVEQNNGYLWTKIIRELSLIGKNFANEKIIPLNATGLSGEFKYIHSGKYQQLIEHFGLAPKQLSKRIKSKLAVTKVP